MWFPLRQITERLEEAEEALAGVPAEDEGAEGGMGGTLLDRGWGAASPPGRWGWWGAEETVPSARGICSPLEAAGG